MHEMETVLITFTITMDQSSTHFLIEKTNLLAYILFIIYSTFDWPLVGQKVPKYSLLCKVVKTQTLLLLKIAHTGFNEQIKLKSCTLYDYYLCVASCVWLICQKMARTKLQMQQFPLWVPCNADMHKHLNVLSAELEKAQKLQHHSLCHKLQLLPESVKNIGNFALYPLN